MSETVAEMTRTSAMAVRPFGSTRDFLLLMEDYHRSFTEAYRVDPTLASLSYEECSKRLFSHPVYYGDAYVDSLTARGFRAEQVVPLCVPLQLKWAADARGGWSPGRLISKLPADSYPLRLAKQFAENRTLHRILERQVATYRPRILWLFSGIPVRSRDIRIWRRHATHVILWWSCPVDEAFPYHEFDLILTAIPSLANRFRSMGIKSTLLAHAFDSRILRSVPRQEDRIPRAVFVGSLSPDHKDRISFLDALSRTLPLDFYGHGREFLPDDSPLFHSYRGPAWAEDLYSVYGSYLVVIHKNIDVAERSASAKRLFEATGMGACVMTEDSDDLRDLFAPDSEVCTYSDAGECAQKVNSLLEHPEQARDIGTRGQKRTLMDHTYAQRVGTLLRQLRDNHLL